ncbi:MAG TPA: MT-A70 family methyltransferase [Pseudolabrys sp.]|jgi:N6-adenosine-specific RNA methylase IME4|nr:MT-A70 family methyltransferase [Pseudolabrys sp.]
MRKHAKLLANFLGATKELTSEYVDLAEITDDELQQIAFTVVKREDRKATAKMLAAKGLSTRDIAKITGWGHETIARDLRGSNEPKTVSNETASKPSATGGRAANRAAVAERASAEGVTAAPSDKYRVIYADPPWDYGAHAQPDYQTEQRDHYAVMELDAICAEHVSDWVEDDAVLFLWVTSPILEKAFSVIQAWGFQYKASFVWDKIKHNMGHYNSVRHELLLICTRGACQPDHQQLFDSVQSIERGKHSAKPVEFYDIIETLYTHGRRLEMYGRQRRDGWDVYGHVAEITEAAE